MYKWLGKLAWAFAVLGGLAAALVALMVVASIVGRSLFTHPIPGDVELTQMGVALCISLCLPWCQLHGSNIIVDFFTQRASAATNRVLDAVGGLLMTVMVWLLAWRTAVGAQSVAQAHEATMILDLPMWWVYAALAPGLALAGVIALWQAVLRLAGRDVSVAVW
jgi:TRAP-type C4-dicarboxylate transport system permease small subunit